MKNMDTRNSYRPWIRRMQSMGLSLALLALLLLFVSNSEANNTRKLTHTSWTVNKTRFDFIFDPEEPIKNVIKLESDASNYLTKSLEFCANKSACLIQDGKFLQAFELDNTDPHRSLFVSLDGQTVQGPASAKSFLDECRQNKFIVTHYCSTNWNPPAYLYRNKCTHSIEWHSPLRCHLNSTSYERPCYIYDEAGRLIDLTPWVLSNGSSYQVDTGVNQTAIKKFSLNVCNEASNVCGPNVSSCFIDEKHGLIESGYNNLTSIKYDPKTKEVLLTQLGQFNPQCEDSRIKTVVYFGCKNQVATKSMPKLVRSSACESIIEWQTVHACPVTEIKVPATDCKIHYEPLNIDLNLKQLAHDLDVIEVSNISVNGENRKMVLGVCRGIPRSKKCGGKETSATTACLINSVNETSPLNANNSEVVGSIMNSFIRFSDDRIYLESTAVNKSCTIKTSEQAVKITKQLGTRVEFYCSQEPQDKPVFLGFDDCTYTFEWGSPLACFESLPLISQMSFINNQKISSPVKPVFVEQPVNKKVADVSISTTAKPRRTSHKLDTTVKTGIQMHAETLGIAQEFSKVHQQTETKDKKEQVRDEPKPAVHQAVAKQVDIKPLSSKPQSKVDSRYKFFMITLIVMSFVGFVVVIIVLDKKTRLRVPLSAIRRQARQAFQPQPVPYSRVGAFNDCLDL